MEQLNTLSITCTCIDFTADIEDILKDMITLASRVGTRVECEINNVHIIAHAKDDFIELHKKVIEAMHSNNRHKIAILR